MRVQDNPALAEAFQELVGQATNVLGEPALTNQPTAVAVVPTPPTTEAASPVPVDIWKPTVNTTWQWQLTGTAIDRRLMSICMTSTCSITMPAWSPRCMHRVVKWYVMSVWVAGKDWRPDKDQFPDAVIGKTTRTGWRKNGSTFARLTCWPRSCAPAWICANPKALTHRARQHRWLFPMIRVSRSLCRQLKYNRWLADEAHARGLSIGLKNDPDQAVDLGPSLIGR